MAWHGLSVLAALQGGPKLTRQLADALGMSSANTRANLVTLAARGLVRSREGCHQLTREGLEVLAVGREVTSGPGPGKAVTHHRFTLRARAWRAMRIREVFSLDDLMLLLCDGEEKDAARNLGDYIRALAIAGYLAPMRRQHAGRHGERWRLTLAGNTGPDAPAWNKAQRIVTDQNTGRTFMVGKILLEKSKF